MGEYRGASGGDQRAARNIDADGEGWWWQSSALGRGEDGAPGTGLSHLLDCTYSLIFEAF